MTFDEYRVISGTNTLTFAARSDQVEDLGGTVKFPLYIEVNPRGQTKGEVVQATKRKGDSNVFMRVPVSIEIEKANISEIVSSTGGELQW